MNSMLFTNGGFYNLKRGKPISQETQQLWLQLTVCAHVRVCMSVFVCVCVRERERERGRGIKAYYASRWHWNIHNL